MRKPDLSLTRWFKNLTIKFKMVILVVGITAVILAISFSMWSYFDRKEFKAVISEKLKILAGTVGHNSRVAVMFKEETSATEILASLEHDPKILEAALYDSEGQIITHYLGKGIPEFERPSKMAEGILFFDDYIEIILPIIFKTKKVGVVFLKYSLSGFKERSQKNLLILLSIGLFGLVFALFSILKLQSLITMPLYLLADSAKHISEKEDYELKIDYESDDEIGTLCKGFNEMLQQLKSRENELEKYRSNLEELVIKRTGELIQANSNLIKQIEERKSAEKKLNVSLAEKEILLKEVNHRVKNNMQILSSLLSMQAREFGEGALFRKFEDSRLRISAMALTHEYIFDSPDLTQIDLQEYLYSIFGQQLQSFGFPKERINFCLYSDLNVLPANFLMYLGLIVNELFSNSLKHAFPDNRSGNISMSINLVNGGDIEIFYRDDGVGFSNTFEDDIKESLRLRLLKQLIFGQLQGKMIFKSRKPVEIFITFPLSVEYE